MLAFWDWSSRHLAFPYICHSLISWDDTPQSSPPPTVEVPTPSYAGHYGAPPAGALAAQYPAAATASAAPVGRSSAVIAWVLAAIFFVTSLVFGGLFVAKSNEVASQRKQLAALRGEVNLKQQQLDSMQKDFEKLLGAGADLLGRLNEAKDIIDRIDPTLWLLACPSESSRQLAFT